MSEEIKALLFRKERRIGELEREHEQSAARVEQLEAEIAELKEKLQHASNVADYAESAHDELLARTQKLLDALEWYADEKKYFKRVNDEMKYFKRVNPPLNLKKTTAVFHSKDPDNLPEDLVTTSYECSARIKVDQGKRARQALAEYRGGDGDRE